MDSRRYSAFVALSASALLILAGLLVSGIVPFSTPGNSVGLGPISSSATGNFDQLVVVLMENHNLNEIYGPAPYMTQLADQYAFSEGWSSITNPSQPNYIALLGASTFGVSGDGNHPNLNHPTLVDLIETSGHTWNAIAEGSGSGCSINPDRGEDHFPFLSYTTITGSAARCASLHSGGPTDVVAALNAGTNFIWFTPTDQHNMHDNSVASGDSWLQSWVPGLLTAMGSKKAALIIMFDEAYTSPPYIYMSFSGTATKLAYKSTASYSHYSLAKLLEDVWGGGSLGQGDVNAPSPLEFFNAGGPDFTLSANPGTVSFSAGQSATSTVSLTASGGFTGTVDLTAVSVPTGVTTSCVPTSISGSQTSTCTLSGTNAGTYAVTITGTSGALVHTAPVAVTITAAGPTARFAYSPTVPVVNDTITFDASTSTDSDPTATLQARWDWESDGTWDTSLSSTLTAQHAFGASGTYTVMLQIQDSNGFSDTDSKAISVFASGGGGVGAPPGYGLTDPTLLQAHGPIYIGSDAQFTAANGVRSGTGTIADPYIISNWFIDGNLYASSQAMLWIEGTSSYVVIENVRISNLLGTNQWEAFQLGHWPATISTQHVTIRHNEVVNAQHAYGIGIREGSSDIHIEANYVQLEANFDWVYGIATDRGVHGITVFGNYVNAHTSGTFHTVGIHLSDYHVTDGRRATGMVAIQNTVVNATAGGIISESSVGTIIGWNLVYMDYPGSKSIAVDYPRGIETEWFSNGTLVIGNVIHTFHWGIQVGSDQGVIASNTISDVDFAIYVLDNAAWPGISTAADTVYDTTYSSVAITPIRLPTGFQGTVVDLGPGIKKTDLTPVLFVTSPAATSATFDWSGTSLNLSAIVGGMVVFDRASTVDAQTLHASWTGTLTNLDVTSLSAAGVSFQLQSAAAVVFDGTGFTPSTTYNVTRTNTGGTSRILSAQSTPLGGNWYTSAVTVTLSATDDSSGVAVIHFRTNGGAWQSYSGPFTFQAAGSHAIDYYSTDYSGNNETLRSVTVNIDGTAPSSSVQLAGTQAGDGSYISTVDVTVTSTDATSGVQLAQYRVDGGAWRSYSAAFPVSGNGTHTVDYYATDVAGNLESAKSLVVRISGSSFGPPVTVLHVAGTAGQNGWYISRVNVTLTATSPSGTGIFTMYSVDGSGWTQYAQTFMMAEGRHTLDYQSWDSAGFVEPKGSTSIDIDLTPPLLDGSPSGLVTTPDVTITWTGSDGASGVARYEVSIDGGPTESVGMTTSLTRRWSDGDHTVRVTAYDAAGNQDAKVISFTVSPASSGVFGVFQTLPLILPAIALCILLFAVAFWRRRLHRNEAEDRGEPEADDLPPEDYDSSEW
ncbi:hypothetical protein AUG86_01185 [Euryarchaeota archaeon 13_1_20CM_4_64_14]|nr:MAG: hypothetical protein AUG86_01185 [Euryarchaeota archaeon 13_1_20CM_4_64_14]